jgi:hypothetical protein
MYKLTDRVAGSLHNIFINIYRFKYTLWSSNTWFEVSERRNISNSKLTLQTYIIHYCCWEQLNTINCRLTSLELEVFSLVSKDKRALVVIFIHTSRTRFCGNTSAQLDDQVRSTQCDCSQNTSRCLQKSSRGARKDCPGRRSAERAAAAGTDDGDWN